MLTLIIAVALGFILSILLRKKFGLPVLGLAAGSIISRDWSSQVQTALTPYAAGYETYAPVILIVIPSLLILLFGKAKVKKLPQKLINSGIYAVTLGVFLVGILPISEVGGQIATLNLQYGSLIMGVALVLAVFQVAFGRAKKKPVEEPQPGHSHK